MHEKRHRTDNPHELTGHAEIRLEHPDAWWARKQAEENTDGHAGDPAPAKPAPPPPPPRTPRDESSLAGRSLHAEIGPDGKVRTWNPAGGGPMKA